MSEGRNIESAAKGIHPALPAAMNTTTLARDSETIGEVQTQRTEPSPIRAPGTYVRNGFDLVLTVE